ncbi:MAG: Nif3-like dinuclear metal center hexameric protein [Proteiniphilum sp.]|jgi:dinuclear metal center YbgI/SA1388 family protein|nr:Nif3-like dinuclear metal center hexameric protein [Proteiniphilum sp.]
MRIKEIIQTIEQVAPLPLQEGYDNSGLQTGDVNREVTGILLCIDVTDDVMEEAVSLGCNLVISHHPLAFRPFRSLTGKNYAERCMMQAIRHDIALYAAHTSLDNARGGVNFKLAEMLELQHVKILRPLENALLKFVTTVPQQHAESVRNALFNAGAGHIGNYDSCSYNLSGEGTFRAGEGAAPYVGEVGRLHFEPEVRIETVIPVMKRDETLRALLAVHPYEEPVFDLYPIANPWSQHGSGVVGVLPEPLPEQEFLYLLKDIFNLPAIRHSKIQGREIRDVALCGGAGAFLIPQAVAYGADAFVTGEAKYNDFYDVEGRLLLATVGHYESEICTKEIFFNLISKKYPTFAPHRSAFDANPVKYL